MNKQDIFDRYSRQIFIEEIGVAGQRKIMAAKVLVIGAGGLGSPVIQYLAAAGVGTLGIVDHDHVEIHNLNRQIIHREESIHQDKVQSAFRFVKEINSNIHCHPFSVKINAENAENILNDYDIIVDGSDNFTTRYIINDACLNLGKTLIYGSIFSFEGQFAVFNHHGSKHLRDLFPEPPHSDDIPDCDTNGVLGPLPGIIGSMMAMQTLKIITGLPVDINQLTIVDTYHWRFTNIGF